MFHRGFRRHQEQPRRRPVSAVSRPNIGASPIVWLMQLGRNHGAAILRKTLDEERATDQRLTSRAEGKVDIRAAS